MKMPVGARSNLKAFAALLCAGIAFGLASCDSTANTADLRWTEPVQLASGETVTVRRHVFMVHNRALGGNFSSAPIYETSSLEVVGSDSELPMWDAPLVPVVLDKDGPSNEWVIVASAEGCDIWLRNGRPRPPYWAFRLRDGEWYRVPIPESFIGRPANLFIGFEVSDRSEDLNARIDERKRTQGDLKTHPRHYNKIDDSYEEFEIGCGRKGPDEEKALDLHRFRSLP
jgi:hypothetical protein